MYFLYILKCTDASLYTGITTDVERRFKEHADGKGGNYTRSHGAEKIVHIEKCGDRSAALRREYEVKQMKKIQKQALIFGEKNTELWENI